MHAASDRSSDRLKRVLKTLKSTRHSSTWNLMQAASCCAPSTAVSELRARGHSISCHRGNENSRSVWIYTYHGKRRNA